MNGGWDSADGPIAGVGGIDQPINDLQICSL